MRKYKVLWTKRGSNRVLCTRKYDRREDADRMAKSISDGGDTVLEVVELEEIRPRG